MNYKHIYMCIIAHAKSEEKLGLRKRGNGEYYESHHILPKSLFPLWKNRKLNIVLLTAREHFFCHQLLTKIYPCKQMQMAIVAFYTRPNADYKITSREYEKLKKLNRELSRNRMLGVKKNPESVEKSAEKRRGVKRSEDAKKLMSDRQKELWRSGFYKNKIRKAGHWYTDGTTNIYLNEGDQIPENYYRGRFTKWTQRKHHNMHFWVTDGNINMLLKVGEEVPKGFIKGRKTPWTEKKLNFS